MMQETTSEAFETQIAPEAWQVADLMMSVCSDGLDHPELWSIMPDMLQQYPDIVPIFQDKLSNEHGRGARAILRVLLGMCASSQGHTAEVLEVMAPMAADFSQSPLVQGALFHLKGLVEPENPKYQLTGKICRSPFLQLDVLENTSHQCCASWLSTSAGNLQSTEWQQVWNSDNAQAIRASIHDGSYRYCNKGSCPHIQGMTLTPATELAKESEFWRELLETARTEMPAGPETVNLAYDRTCNLSCPSCRSERYAADDAARARYDEMQQNKILPLLKNAKTVFITGSGDPFASKNFRRLMEQLTPEEYPELSFQIMTNGMLFTPRQWEAFPALHGRTRILKISIDAATGPTHELLRRGARWPVMLDNMKFAGELTAKGLVDHYELVFTVQEENWREMGDAVTLAHEVGATGVYFARITNWGTFSDDEYRRKAVFLPTHPDYAEFVEVMQDPRLIDPMVLLGDLRSFVRETEGNTRAFVH